VIVNVNTAPRVAVAAAAGGGGGGRGGLSYQISRRRRFVLYMHVSGKAAGSAARSTTFKIVCTDRLEVVHI